MSHDFTEIISGSPSHSSNKLFSTVQKAELTDDDNETSTIGCGGVRVYGKDHKIFNNYFEGLTGSKWDAACTLTCGDALNTNVTNSSDLTKHYVVENLEFVHNTLINNASDIEIGYRDDWGKAPINCLIANNIITQAENEVCLVLTSGKETGVSFADNIIYTTGSASYGDISFTEDQAKNIDPLLEQTNGRVPQSTIEVSTATYKLTAASPAINSNTSHVFSYLEYDAEGQAVQSVRDLGADEYNSADAVTNGVLDASHVGPNAIDFTETGSSDIKPITKSSVSVSPNPFVNKTTIHCDGKASLCIYDLHGKVIHQTIINDSYEWQSVQRGVFVAVLRSGNGYQEHIKLIAE